MDAPSDNAAPVRSEAEMPTFSASEVMPRGDFVRDDPTPEALDLPDPFRRTYRQLSPQEAWHVEQIKTKAWELLRAMRGGSSSSNTPVWESIDRAQVLLEESVMRAVHGWTA